MIGFKGLICSEALQNSKRAVAARLCERGLEPAAVLSDYSGCLLVVSRAELQRMMAGRWEDLPWLPAAVVAPPGWLAPMRSAALNAAVKTGAWRLVMDEPDGARAVLRTALTLQARGQGRRRR